MSCCSPWQISNTFPHLVSTPPEIIRALKNLICFRGSGARAGGAVEIKFLLVIKHFPHAYWVGGGGRVILGGGINLQEGYETKFAEFAAGMGGFRQKLHV